MDRSVTGVTPEHMNEPHQRRAVYPMPGIERLVHDGDVLTVTCPGCKR